MRQFRYVICDAAGLHARPCGELVRLAMQLPDRITLEVGGRLAQASDILAVMGLDAGKNAEVTVTVEGNEEQQTAGILERFFRENL